MKAFTVTLTAGNTNYSLRDLVRVIDSVIDDSAKQIDITADKANTDDVLIGDDSLSATRYGNKLAATDSVTLRHRGLVHLSNLTARSVTALQKVSITLW